jgi:chromosome segregation ATPase
MTQLSEAYEKLLQEYKHLKEQHQKIRARKEDKGPSQADIEQLNKETTQFINTAKNYDNKYRSLKHELNGLYDLVSKLAPGSENKDSGPTPTLR